MHQQVLFNTQELYILPTFYEFHIYLWTNSDFCPIQHKLIGFYNRDEKCLLRGTDCVFKCVKGMHLTQFQVQCKKCGLNDVIETIDPQNHSLEL